MSDQWAVKEKVSAAVWRRVFVEDKDGAAILEELMTEHVDAEPFVAGSPDQTNYNLGMRGLVMKIVGKLAE